MQPTYAPKASDKAGDRGSDSSIARYVATDGGPSLPPALKAERHYLRHRGLRIAMYLSTPKHHAFAVPFSPLVLVHSINAAASAAEVKPIFDHYAGSCPVLAVELPGFGASDRPGIAYTPQLMSDCIMRAVEYLGMLGFTKPVDLIAVSLSCEMAAHAALSDPASFRSLGFVNPTGFESEHRELYERGRTKDKPWLRRVLESGPWSEPMFRWLTSEPSIRKFLEGTWGSKDIDEGLLAYNLLSVSQPGARHAPYAFIGGSLFTRGVRDLYERLPVPVWMVHGRKGVFARFDGLAQFSPQVSWSVESMDTGALPYFERPAEFAKRYEAFIAGLSSYPKR